MIEKIYGLREKIDAKVIRASIVISSFCSPLLSTSVAYAKVTPAPATSTSDLDFLKNGSAGDNQTFNQITTTAQQTGYSGYKLFMVICIIGLALSGGALGLSIAVTHNTNKKSEKKAHLMDFCIGALIVFGILTIIGLIKGVADALNVPKK